MPNPRKIESSHHHGPSCPPAEQTFEMDDSSDSSTLAAYSDDGRATTAIQEKKSGLPGVARHTLGLILLLLVVFLWTTSNFLGSVRAGRYTPASDRC